MTKKTRTPLLHVACAIIEKNGQVLAAQRGRSMRMPLRWEFPGGKIDPGESAEGCLKREIAEELSVAIAVRRAMPPCTHDYPDFAITLHPFVCTIASGEITLNEHRAIAWLCPEELPLLNWTEADIPVVNAYRKSLADRP